MKRGVYLRGGHYANPWAQPAIEQGVRASTRNRWMAIVVVFLCALGVRLLYAGPAIEALYGVEQERYRIAEFYHDASASLAEGDDRVVFPSISSPRDTLVVGYPPGYFVVMSIIYRVASNPMAAVILAQCVIDALTCVVLLLLGEALFSTGVGVFAGLLMGISPQFASLSVVLKPDTLTVLPVLGAMLLLVRAVQRPTIARWIAAGLLLGVSCWLRQNALVLAPVLALVAIAIAPRRAIVGRAIVMVLVCVACVLPLTIRNFVLYRTPIPVTIGSGFALLSGLARDDFDNRYDLPRFAYNVSTGEAEERGLDGNRYFVEFDELQASHARKFETKHSVLSVFTVDAIDRDRERSHRALGLIASDPGYFSRIYFMRIGRLMGYTQQNRAVPLEGGAATHAYETLAFDRTIEASGARWRRAIRDWAPLQLVRPAVALLQRPFSTTVLLVLAAIGLVLATARSWRKTLILLVLPAYYLGLQALMWAEFRHTLPVHASVFLLCGLAFSSAWSLARYRSLDGTR